jgi:uncharacterized membrane protein YeiB
MSLIAISWLFTLGALLHNAEEALFLPAWSQRVGRFYKPVTARMFRTAVIILSGLFVAVTVAASVSRPGSIAAYLMAGYALAMVLNVFVPHVLATVATRMYMPGTATAVLLNLPLGLLYLSRTLAQAHVTLPTFYWAGPAVVLGILALLPGLFAVARWLHAAINQAGAT